MGVEVPALAAPDGPHRPGELRFQRLAATPPPEGRSVLEADAIVPGPPDAGGSVVAGGDLDGDGFADLVFGQTLGDEDDAGTVYWFRGPVTGEHAAAEAEASFAGSEPHEHAGTAVANAGDVDGDGLDDILIGASGIHVGDALVGGAYLLLEPTTGDFSLGVIADAALTGPTDETVSSLGWAVGGGDLDGDGHAGLVVGGVDSESFVVSGPVTGTVALGTDADGVVVSTYRQIGFAVSDLDGDGFEDLAIRTERVDSAVVFGPVVGTVDLDRADVQVESSSRYASTMAGADFTGDGGIDLAIAYLHGDGRAGVAVLSWTGW